MAIYERKMGFADSEPITPADHDEILRFLDNRRGHADDVFAFATGRSSPARLTGTRADPPLKPVHDLDWENDSDLLREIMR
jgi:hypothetical protein